MAPPRRRGRPKKEESVLTENKTTQAAEKSAAASKTTAKSAAKRTAKKSTAKSSAKKQTKPAKKPQGDTVFALDIGTRTVVGVLGVMDGDVFRIKDTESVPHLKRAMIDGQVEDIEQVAKVA